MAVLDPSDLPSEIYLDIKYQTTTSFLISFWNMLPILQYFKGYNYLVHLFCIGILPQSVSIIFVKIYGFFNVVGNMYSKIVVTFPNSSIHQRNNAIYLLKSIRQPPQKLWFIIQSKSCCIRK